jgi:hypothetical protein
VHVGRPSGAKEIRQSQVHEDKHARNSYDVSQRTLTVTESSLPKHCLSGKPLSARFLALPRAHARESDLSVGGVAAHHLLARPLNHDSSTQPAELEILAAPSKGHDRTETPPIGHISGHGD